MRATLEVKTRHDAEGVVDRYWLRWRIEAWHRVLEPGCKVERLGYSTGDRIERAVTIKAVIAWRLTAMTLIGRDTTELPAEILYSDIEIVAPKDFAKDRKLAEPGNPGYAVLVMAILGGCLNRKNDLPPGHHRIWKSTPAWPSRRRPTSDSCVCSAPVICIGDRVPNELQERATAGCRSQNGPATPTRNLTSGLACGRFPALEPLSCSGVLWGASDGCLAWGKQGCD